MASQSFDSGCLQGADRSRHHGYMLAPSTNYNLPFASVVASDSKLTYSPQEISQFVWFTKFSANRNAAPLSAWRGTSRFAADYHAHAPIDAFGLGVALVQIINTDWSDLQFTSSLGRSVAPTFVCTWRYGQFPSHPRALVDFESMPENTGLTKFLQLARPHAILADPISVTCDSQWPCAKAPGSESETR